MASFGEITAAARVPWFRSRWVMRESLLEIVQAGSIVNVKKRLKRCVVTRSLVQDLSKKRFCCFGNSGSKPLFEKKNEVSRGRGRGGTARGRGLRCGSEESPPQGHSDETAGNVCSPPPLRPVSPINATEGGTAAHDACFWRADFLCASWLRPAGLGEGGGPRKFCRTVGLGYVYLLLEPFFLCPRIIFRASSPSPQ